MLKNETHEKDVKMSEEDILGFTFLRFCAIIYLKCETANLNKANLRF